VQNGMSLNQEINGNLCDKNKCIKLRISFDNIHIEAKYNSYALREIYFHLLRPEARNTYCIACENASGTFHAQGPEWIHDKKGNLPASAVACKVASGYSSVELKALFTRINPQ